VELALESAMRDLRRFGKEGYADFVAPASVVDGMRALRITATPVELFSRAGTVATEIRQGAMGGNFPHPGSRPTNPRVPSGSLVGAAGLPEAVLNAEGAARQN
jgi:hypothetical protein